MKAITFPQANTNIAEDSDEYRTLPAYVGELTKDKIKGIVCCLELDDEDIEELLKHRKLWLSVLTFGKPLQPFFITAGETVFNK